ncbi:hypothetical protein [Flavobacterium hungaricum]|uniref:Uncharacterized protein n=1 Tax=Flavobacterium hungaricum TaxID=2082725 RepID=A0ABR9TJW2_9FLAO|nr:hypothetical protein [Flavobacterium hungaricum]MBE8725630.1 hypothetical protein [Flavobacterium hungaricum]
MKNLKNSPEIILKAKSSGSVLNYKWTKKTIQNLIDPLEKNNELEIALNKIGHKAAMGLTAALLEWVYWRYKGFGTSGEEIRQRIEAIWSTIENPENTKPLVFDENLDFPAFGFVNGPIWVALMNVRMIDLLYKQGSNFLQSELVGLVLLARHITPKKKYFDRWFNHVMESLIEIFPNQNFNKAAEIENSFYDFSNEPAICREFFFDLEFNYDDAKSKEALNNFIEQIDYNSNLFCFDQKTHQKRS